MVWIHKYEYQLIYRGEKKCVIKSGKPGSTSRNTPPPYLGQMNTQLVIRWLFGEQKILEQSIFSSGYG